MSVIGDLPLVNNRQSRSIESHEHYNVKARGYTWVTPQRRTKVNADVIANDNTESDAMLLDHVAKKSRSHNNYFPAQHSTVNKNWRPGHIDLDKDQYNHMRIPVNHSVSWMAPVFVRKEGTNNGVGEDVTIIDSKYLNPEYKPCMSRAAPTENRNVTRVDFDLPSVRINDDVKYSNVRASVREKGKCGTTDIASLIDERTVKQNYKIRYQQPSIRLKDNGRGDKDRDGSTPHVTLIADIGSKQVQKRVAAKKLRPNDQQVVIERRSIVGDKPTFMQSGGYKPLVRQCDLSHPAVELDRNPNIVTYSPNLLSNIKKVNNEFDTDLQTRDYILQASIEMLRSQNRREEPHNVPVLERKPFEDVEAYDLRPTIRQFDRFTPEFSAIRK